MNVFLFHSTELHHAFESDHKILLPNGTIFQRFLVKKMSKGFFLRNAQKRILLLLLPNGDS